MSDESEPKISQSCPFCNVGIHYGAYLDELERQIMECRDKADGRKRGDLDSYSEDELNGQRPLLEYIPLG